MLLADEINRASPRTQSALLEAMNEAQVTVDGVTHPLAAPFFVIATQNPRRLPGHLPAARGAARSLPPPHRRRLPAEDDELAMLFARQREDPLDEVEPVATREDLLAMQAEVRDVEVKEAVGAVPARASSRRRASTGRRARREPARRARALPRGAGARVPARARAT